MSSVVCYSVIETCLDWMGIDSDAAAWTLLSAIVKVKVKDEPLRITF